MGRKHFAAICAKLQCIKHDWSHLWMWKAIERRSIIQEFDGLKGSKGWQEDILVYNWL